ASTHGGPDLPADDGRGPQGRVASRCQGRSRAAIIDNFREGKEKVLITTNVIARGIDTTCRS
ncbi:hypothetical protein OH77DRAFT_1491322, partial [Trametes cingulata]